MSVFIQSGQFLDRSRSHNFSFSVKLNWFSGHSLLLLVILCNWKKHEQQQNFRVLQLVMTTHISSKLISYDHRKMLDHESRMDLFAECIDSGDNCPQNISICSMFDYNFSVLLIDCSFSSTGNNSSYLLNDSYIVSSMSEI